MEKFTIEQVLEVFADVDFCMPVFIEDEKGIIKHLEFIIVEDDGENFRIIFSSMEK